MKCARPLRGTTAPAAPRSSSRRRSSPRQVPARERDCSRAVARQQDVDDDGLGAGQPEPERSGLHGGASSADGLRAPAAYRTDSSSFPISAGFFVTLMPQASITASFSCAVPFPPEMIAPAWPMRLPGGAVTPAMKPTTGFLM